MILKNRDPFDLLPVCAFGSVFFSFFFFLFEPTAVLICFPSVARLPDMSEMIEEQPVTEHLFCTAFVHVVGVW